MAFKLTNMQVRRRSLALLLLVAMWFSLPCCFADQDLPSSTSSVFFLHSTFRRTHRRLMETELKWKEIQASGSDYACGVTLDKWAMGWGNVPVYGNSSSVYQTKTPITIAPGQNWEQLACGSGFICGLKTNKQLTCWGSGDYALDYTTPKTWPGKYKYVSAKERHVCAVKEDGSVWCAGSNGKGELGSGEVQVGASSKDPVPVTMRDSSDETFVMVSTGNSHTCALSVDSEIFCWGNNNDGQVGQSKFISGTKQLTDTSMPLKVSSEVQWQDVSAGKDFTCAIDARQSLYCFGGGAQGQLSDNVTAPGHFEDEPTPVPAGGNWDEVSAGGSSALGLKDGNLWSWGGNEFGQRGDGTQNQVTPYPSFVPAYAGQWKQISAGETFSCGVLFSHEGLCWGDPRFGVLGRPGVNGPSLVPEYISSVKNSTNLGYDPESTGTSIGVIIGAVMVGFVGALVLIGGVAFYRKKRRQKKKILPVNKVGGSGKDLEDSSDLEVGQRRPSVTNGTGINGPNISTSPFAQAATSGNMTTDDSDIDSANRKNPTIANDALLQYVNNQNRLKEDAAAAAALMSSSSQLMKGNGNIHSVSDGTDGRNESTSDVGTDAGENGNTNSRQQQQRRSNESTDSKRLKMQQGSAAVGLAAGNTFLSSTMSQAASSSLVDVRPWAFDFSELEIMRVLGEGSFGRVYLAKWKETLIAVKILLEEGEPVAVNSNPETAAITLSSSMLGKLRDEAELMGKLRHPNIVNLVGVCTSPPCIATEYCRRGSLYHVLRDATALPAMAAQLTWKRRLAMAMDAARGMLFLHIHKPPIVHRDLKSPNLLVTASYEVKVSDFNLSRLMEDSYLQNSRASTAGGFNPRWLAPEMLESATKASARSDVYAFGIVLWELLTWELPWGNLYPWAIAHNVQRRERPAIPATSELPGMTPDADGNIPGLTLYIELMQRCWAQEPSDRPDFQEIIKVLKDISVKVELERANTNTTNAITAPPSTQS